MKIIIRNFTSIFRKFVAANLLNLLGLSLAFASFFVIMTQVNYDLGYNKSFAEHEKLFRLTLELGPGMEDYGTTLPRPLVEQLAAKPIAAPSASDGRTRNTTRCWKVCKRVNRSSPPVMKHSRITSN